jgi:hypothetical protein
MKIFRRDRWALKHATGHPSTTRAFQKHGKNSGKRRYNIIPGITGKTRELTKDLRQTLVSNPKPLRIQSFGENSSLRPQVLRPRQKLQEFL